MRDAREGEKFTGLHRSSLRPSRRCIEITSRADAAEDSLSGMKGYPFTL